MGKPEQRTEMMLGKAEKRRGAIMAFEPGTAIAEPDEPQSEDAAVAAGLDALVASGQWRTAEPSTPAAEFYQELGLTPQRRGRPAGTSRDGAFRGRILVRVPASVHQELAERAEAEGTTVNQLILYYIGRGLGADAAAATALR